MLLWALVGVMISILCGAVVIAGERRRSPAGTVTP